MDTDGIVYANSEDGFLYAIDRTGVLCQKIFLSLTLGAAYTPVSLDETGLIFTQNNGHLFVVGNPLRLPPVPVGRSLRTRLRPFD